MVEEAIMPGSTVILPRCGVEISWTIGIQGGDSCRNGATSQSRPNRWSANGGGGHKIPVLDDSARESYAVLVPRRW